MIDQQPTSPGCCARVAILLCTRNGEFFLPQQLESYATQTYSAWTVYASDDSSTDRTRDILLEYQQAWGRDKLSISDGPGRGGPANFMALVARDDILADYFAFSDQDDIWVAEKLANAVNWLHTVSPELPALYCSRTRYIDVHDNELGLSPLPQRPPGFANALVQNIAGGNTMVFNQAARRLLQRIDPKTPLVVHDWLVYQVVTGCGGKVCFATTPEVRYRQHTGNLIGANAGWWSRLRRARESLRGMHRQWCDIQLLALAQVEPAMTPENTGLFKRFQRARQQWLIPRALGIWRAGVYRQTPAQRFWFWLQVMLKRV